MLDTTIGTAFVDTYYRVSPPIANYIADHATLRAVVRAVLTPIVWVAQMVLAAPMLMLCMIVGMVMTLVAARRKKALR